MSRDALMNSLAVALIGSAFAVAGWRILSIQSRDADPRRVVIRFSHWQLESGLREAFDAICRDYMALHPGVEVQQIPVPGRVNNSWMQTRYVGDTLPDLAQLGAVDDATLSRYYTPLTEWVDQPNPYNRGTPLEHVPWRETFVDGLAGSAGLTTLQEYYSVPVAVVTTRMFVNLDLYRRVMGDAPLPTDYRGMIAVCERVQRWSADRGQAVRPLAGSQFTANVLMERLFKSQTQRLALEMDAHRALLPPEGAALLLHPRMTLDEPAIRSGYALMHEVGGHMQRGFMSGDRDQAIFDFAQGRALFLPTGSWDYGSILEQSAFEVGVIPMPMPDPGDPRFGRHTLGPASEAGQGVGLRFHMAASTRHPERTLDFLRFLTSVEFNRKFAHVSKWLPAVVGVQPAEESRPFEPITGGATQGFSLAPVMWGATEVYRVQLRHIYLLVDEGGSVDRFLAALKRDLPAAAAADVERGLRGLRDNAARADMTLAAARALARHGDPRAARKASALWQTQNAQESQWLQLRWSQSRARSAADSASPSPTSPAAPAAPPTPTPNREGRP